jgi:hypothetical protein
VAGMDVIPRVDAWRTCRPIVARLAVEAGP